MEELEKKLYDYFKKEKFASYGSLIFMHNFANDKMFDIRKSLEVLTKKGRIRLINGVYELNELNLEG